MDQPDYLNAVVVLATVLGPRPLLRRCLEIEQEAGRLRRQRWGPRVIDLDLLLYGDAVIDGEGLRVPHPGLVERHFVLAPLCEVWPSAPVPGHGIAADLLEAVTNQVVTQTELEW